MRSASNRVRRARPSLGTFVEITARGDSEAKLHSAIDRAFAAVARVDRQMSFHHPASDISRINREAFQRKLTVDPWTWRVLQAAQKLSHESDGLFDITVARKLMQWNYLPRRYRNVNEGNWRDIALEKNCTVRFRQPAIVDLGGIAKGFAVDRAVEALKRAGVRSGVVNAGGDLRVFGLKSELVHLRRPDKPMQLASAINLRERALATSGIYFARKKRGREVVTSLLDGRTCRSSRKLISVSVAASSCMTADALTKIVFILREKSQPLLARYHADALLLERDGAPLWMFRSSCDTRDRTRFD
ncbi:MAG TPA: FAD:protein FMN transferase [Candidatus Udaeobacter sp.]|jgi:thiamine biosynthesis lipoprotein|nr:FAD:protein FMN transferase [Candidatus Udaeobacter sp.]